MTFPVPTRDTVSSANQHLFDGLTRQLGMVPNLCATQAHSEHALTSYLALQSAKTSIKGKAGAVVNLVVSQVNGRDYCLAGHTLIGRMVGFTPAQFVRGRVLRPSPQPVALVQCHAGPPRHATRRRRNLGPCRTQHLRRFS